MRWKGVSCREPPCAWTPWKKCDGMKPKPTSCARPLPLDPDPPPLRRVRDRRRANRPPRPKCPRTWRLRRPRRPPRCLFPYRRTITTTMERCTRWDGPVRFCALGARRSGWLRPSCPWQARFRRKRPFPSPCRAGRSAADSFARPSFSPKHGNPCSRLPLRCNGGPFRGRARRFPTHEVFLTHCLSFVERLGASPTHRLFPMHPRDPG